jgi:hypothetical protein
MRREEEQHGEKDLRAKHLFPLWFQQKELLKLWIQETRKRQQEMANQNNFKLATWHQFNQTTNQTT